MRNVMALWCTSNAEQFEEIIPLKFIGQRNNTLGFSNDIDILLLEGYDLLDKQYVDSLQGFGFKLYDANKIYSRLSDKYNSLNQFSDYNKKCFLRWPVIKEFYQGQSIIHYDGDVVFNENPLVLQQKLKGKTFVLQGCPAITVISNMTWYEQYLENLDQLASNVDQYSLNAWNMREGWENSMRTKWAGYRETDKIRHDQDLFSHLIHTGQIIQDKPGDIISENPEYFFFENALCIDDANDGFPYKYRRTNGIDYLNDKKVALWHIQTSFNIYLYDFIFRKNYFGFLNNCTLRYGKSWTDKIFHKIIKKIKGINRCSVYQYYFQEHDFSEVFTNKVWWKKGIFE